MLKQEFHEQEIKTYNRSCVGLGSFRGDVQLQSIRFAVLWVAKVNDLWMAFSIINMKGVLKSPSISS